MFNRNYRHLILLVAFLPFLFGSGYVINSFGTFGAGGGGGGGDTLISDDFSTDTSADYSEVGTVGDGMQVSSGIALGADTGWVHNAAFHETSIGSNNHYVEGYIEYTGTDGTGLIVRCDGTVNAATGYMVLLESTRLRAYDFSGLSPTGLSPTSGFVVYPALTANTFYKVKVTIDGYVLHGYIDLNDDGDYDDADEDGGELTDGDSLYATGPYIGMWFKYTNNGQDLRIDDLEADQ